MADVGVVQVQVDEVPQAAVLLHQVALEAAVGREQSVDDLAHGGAGELDGFAPSGKAAEGSGDAHSHGHVHTSLSASSDSNRMTGRSSSSVQLAASRPRPSSTRTIR